MTDKEIIKALKDKINGSDYQCFEDDDVLDLIVRQQAEIERLQSMNQAKLETIHDLQTEIENLKIELSSMRTAANSYKMHYEDGKSDGGVTDDKEVKVLKHKVVRVDNLMYKGCEPHWMCTSCGMCVPFHCYTKEQFESQDCKPDFADNYEKGR